MSLTKFRFKQFELHQELCAMKVGTDSVLLGAWATIPSTGNILDIGTGTGILSLMAAQRSIDAMITAIEIAPQAAQQAQANVSQSPWHNRIEVIEGNFTTLFAKSDRQYDCIISNPPYFEQSLHSPDAARTTARHTTTLTYADIFSIARSLITPRGTLSLVIPADLYEQVNGTAMLYGWGASRLTMVQTTLRKRPKRALGEWRLNHYAPCIGEQLIIHAPDGGYSSQYMQLTRDFYLHF